MFPDNLKMLREAAGLTQAGLGQKVGVPGRTVEGWEQGRREPRFAMLMALAKVLGASTDELLAHKPGRRPKPRRGRPPKQDQ